MSAAISAPNSMLKIAFVIQSSQWKTQGLEIPLQPKQVTLPATYKGARWVLQSFTLFQKQPPRDTSWERQLVITDFWGTFSTWPIHTKASPKRLISYPWFCSSH